MVTETQIDARAERRRLEQELANAQANLNEANRAAQRLDHAITEKKRRQIELHTLLSRKVGPEKATCPENRELKKAVGELAELQVERDQTDVAQEGAARAVQHVRTELDTCLYRHMAVFLADQEERELKLGDKLRQLQSWYRAAEKLWAELTAEYQRLGPALADRLRDHDSSHGTFPDAGTYERAVRPLPSPLPPSGQIVGASPRPVGVERFKRQQEGR